MTEEDFIEQAQPLFRSIYKRSGAGCCLHVVIDDGNWDCMIDDADLKHKDCRKLNELIWQLDYDERERICYDIKTKALTFEEEEDDDYCDHCCRGGY